MDPTNPDNPNAQEDPIHAWWETVSRARSSILSLSALLPSPSPLPSLADSDRPSSALLSSHTAYSSVSSSLTGSSSDPICHWLYDTYLSQDPQLRLFVLSLVPLISGIYLSLVVSQNPPSLSGFEAVLLSIYSSESKSRSGRPLLFTLPDLSIPSIYHSPRPSPRPIQSQPSVTLLSPPLEPQISVKSTKRASIVAIALDCFHKKISLMPPWSKIDLCRFSSSWSGQDCPCRTEFDSHDHPLQLPKCEGSRVPLPWELLQPVVRIVGHCLLGPLNTQEVRDAASSAVRCLYARASHDLLPQAILATRSLIHLDKRARTSAKGVSNSSEGDSTGKAKKPEILLVSK